MADVKPFCGVRYNETMFSIPLVAPPYDIINEQQRQDMAQQEYHMINLDKPGKDDDPDRYIRSKERYRKWKQNNILVQDEDTAFYVYAQRFKHPETGSVFERTGFFALVELEKFYEGNIFPHERTLSGPKIDRLHLMRATKANLSPVFGLYDDENNKAESIFAEVKSQDPLYVPYKDFDGTEHMIWRVTHKKHKAALRKIVKGKNIIIADGHHRYETALTYRDEMRAQKKASLRKKSYDYVLMCLVNFADPGLVVLPTHRLFHLPLEQDSFRKQLQPFFNIVSVEASRIEALAQSRVMTEPTMGLYFGKQRDNYLLTLKNESVLNGVVPESASKRWRTLEVTMLFYVVIKHIMKLNDQDFESKISYSHSCHETFHEIDSGKATCAFLLPPCSKDDLVTVTKAQEVMPQKSTYFYPKIFSGFVVHEHH